MKVYLKKHEKQALNIVLKENEKRKHENKNYYYTKENIEKALKYHIKHGLNYDTKSGITYHKKEKIAYSTNTKDIEKHESINDIITYAFKRFILSTTSGLQNKKGLNIWKRKLIIY